MLNNTLLFDIYEPVTFGSCALVDKTVYQVNELVSFYFQHRSQSVTRFRLDFHLEE
jgi:hypothetical protein